LNDCINNLGKKKRDSEIKQERGNYVQKEETIPSIKEAISLKTFRKKQLSNTMEPPLPGSSIFFLILSSEKFDNECFLSGVTLTSSTPEVDIINASDK
jgi:hypothetical protein